MFERASVRRRAAGHPSAARSAAPPATPAVVDDATLIAQAQAGDAAGFAALFARHRAPLYRTALAMTGREAQAEDFVQETFLRAHRHLDRVVLGPGASLRPWLQRILVHLIYDDSARRRHPMQPLDEIQERLATGQDSTERRFESRELRRTVADAILQLPEKHRLVVVLFYLEDLDVEAIAAVLDVPSGTVKSRLFYGRARLRELLADDAPAAAAREAVAGSPA